MTATLSKSVSRFDRLVLGNPRKVVFAILLGTGLLAIQARHVRLDASVETLVLESDQDLRYAREIQARYGKQALLVLSFTPARDLFADDTLATLARLREELESLDRVAFVRTILDVPLLESAASLESLYNDVPTLESTTENRLIAVNELRQSPLYRDLLINANARTTALLIFLEQDEQYEVLLSRRDALRQRLSRESASQADRQTLRHVRRELRKHRDRMARQRHECISAIRSIMKRHGADGEMFLGGTSMIADDIVTFIKSDLRVFGLGVAGALAISLGIIFQRVRWIILPMLCCLVSVLATIGLLGWLRWDLTVISVNFIPLQLIMTMSLAIHLGVQYQELQAEQAQSPVRCLVLEMVRRKFKPCGYAILTTIAGFGSLLICDVLPLILLGYIMTLGLAISLLVTFLLLPSLLVLLPKPVPSRGGPRNPILIGRFARLTESHGRPILVAAGLVLIPGLLGVSRLEVENRFIDYFRSGTEIHQGMKMIDEQLGGTTPLDVIINFDDSDASTAPPAEDVEDADFTAFDESAVAAQSGKYWFTQQKMSLIREAHQYLDGLPETGKVLSLATSLDIAEKITGDRTLDSFDLALLYSETPERFKALLVAPYASVEHNQARLHLRVRDSDKDLRRDTLLKKIGAELPHKLGLEADDVQLAGLLVLYNNMLRSLYNTQMLTLALTILLISVMLLILFRSWRITLLALMPNLLPVVLVLGVMGWVNLPLDMMTVTIAAIGVSIAVDDTVHYVHRFKVEWAASHDWTMAMYRSHGSVGLAMFYTTATITTGFCILALSNFTPTMYFGLLTGLAMIVALVADLTLLPQLLILAKPFAPINRPRCQLVTPATPRPNGKSSA